MHRFRSLVATGFLLTSLPSAWSAPRPFTQPPAFSESEAVTTFDRKKATGCSPKLTRDAAGHLHYDLRAQWTDPAVTSIFNPNADPTLHEPDHDPLELRSYNGCLVGPTIEARPGQTLYVDLANDLNDAQHPTDPTCINPQHNTANCFNTINLHFHGYHGSPNSKVRWTEAGPKLIASDDIFIETAPGQSQSYEYVIGPDHPAGTFWVHSHRHGSTALQVSSGMEAALIVRGNRTITDKLTHRAAMADIDTVLDRKTFRERILMLQQISYACLDAVGNVIKRSASDPRWHCNDPSVSTGNVGKLENFSQQLNGPNFWDQSGRYTSINGEVRPPIGVATDTIKAGDVERWRVIQGGIRDAVNLRIVAVDAQKAAEVLLAAVSTLRPTAQQRVRAIQAATPSAGRLRELLEALPSGGVQADKDERAAILKGICNGPVVRQVDIAEDGLTRADALEKPTSYLQPGYRTDVLVSFPKAGLYCVLDETASGTDRPGVDDSGGPAADKSLELLTTVTVQDGTPVNAINSATDTRGMFVRYVLDRVVAANAGLPPAVKARLQADDLSDYAFALNFTSAGQPVADTPNRRLNYTIKLPPPPPARFGWTNTTDLSGFQQHDPTQIPFTPVVGSVETWDLSADQTHIHHIHVNPFRILDVRNVSGASIFGPGGDCADVIEPATGAKTADDDTSQYCGLKGAYKDTIFLKGNGNPPARHLVTVQTKYEAFTGEFVLHCHILDHEDQGMMANVCIRQPNRICKPSPHALPGKTSMRM